MNLAILPFECALMRLGGDGGAAAAFVGDLVLPPAIFLLAFPSTGRQLNSPRASW
jgi:hypothetical protein